MNECRLAIHITNKHMKSRFSEFIGGVKAELPLLVGVLPFGTIFGVLALNAGMSRQAAQSMSWIVFAGSAQIVITQLVSVAAPAAVIVIAVFVVNLRHALYSASVAPYLRRLQAPWKWILAYLLTDEAYAVSILYFRRNDSIEEERAFQSGQAMQSNPALNDLSASANPGNYRHYYLLGSGLALWVTWQTSTALGIFLGEAVPASWSLDFTLALTFIALVVPALKDRASLAAALAAGGTAVLAFNMPYKLGLMAAALAGILVGLLVEGRG
jgi:predicted branched-subunit amino acid permease